MKDKSRQLVLGLAMLCHDMGKPSTTEADFSAHGHDQAGVSVAASFLERIGAPKAIVGKILPLVASHMVRGAGVEALSDRAVRRLARKLHPATIEELADVIQADQEGRHALVKGTKDVFAESLRVAARKLSVAEAQAKPLVMGRHLIALGVLPGPAMGRTLALLFEKQLDGEFTTVAAGLAYLSEGGSGGKE